MIGSELSDETVLHLRRKWEVSEERLEPLEMSDTEILDFFSEYCTSAIPTGEISWGVSDGITYFGKTFRDAVRNAAAHHQEANRDF